MGEYLWLEWDCALDVGETVSGACSEARNRGARPLEWTRETESLVGNLSARQTGGVAVMNVQFQRLLPGSPGDTENVRSCLGNSHLKKKKKERKFPSWEKGVWPGGSSRTCIACFTVFSL